MPNVSAVVHGSCALNAGGQPATLLVTVVLMGANATEAQTEFVTIAKPVTPVPPALITTLSADVGKRVGG